jgi:hypothetical protein
LNTGVGVFVDGDDQLRVSHTNEVLDRARDAAGDVQVGGDDFACLTDLVGVGDVSAVHCRAGSADCAAKQRGKFAEHCETFFGGFSLVQA